MTTSASYVDSQLKAAIAPHRRTGTVEQSLDTHPNKVEWSGTNASIQVGFNLDDGGIPSIFLMYGTKVHGQPHVQPDKKLYDAVYGSKNKKTSSENTGRSIYECSKEGDRMKSELITALNSFGYPVFFAGFARH